MRLLHTPVYQPSQPVHYASSLHMIWAGFLATLAMTALIYLGPVIKLPHMDIAALLGSVIAGYTPKPGDAMWAAGMCSHFVNGAVIFPLLYSLILYGKIPGPPIFKGIYFAWGLWLLSEVLVMPALGQGFFSSRIPEHYLAILASFVGHTIYGAILGKLAD